jgi:hypothetical protein
VFGNFNGVLFFTTNHSGCYRRIHGFFQGAGLYELNQARRVAKFNGRCRLAWLLAAIVSHQGQAQSPAPALSEAQRRIAYAELQSVGGLHAKLGVATS